MYKIFKEKEELERERKDKNKSGRRRERWMCGVFSFSGGYN